MIMNIKLKVTELIFMIFKASFSSSYKLIYLKAVPIFDIYSTINEAANPQVKMINSDKILNSLFYIHNYDKKVI
jgi:hypothetical protein